MESGASKNLNAFILGNTISNKTHMQIINEIIMCFLTINKILFLCSFKESSKDFL
jgi:hypothetical protein